MEGADVTLVGYDGVKRVSDAAKEIKARFQADVRVADGSDDGKKADILAAGRGGLLRRTRGRAHPLCAPSSPRRAPADRGRRERRAARGRRRPGHDGNGQELTPHGTLGIGPLAIGNIKYKTESGLFQR